MVEAGFLTIGVATDIKGGKIKMIHVAMLGSLVVINVPYYCKISIIRENTHGVSGSSLQYLYNFLQF
jgi:hypothetical protein